MTQKEQKHNFSVGGHRFSVSQKQAREKLATLRAGEIEEVRKLYIEVGGRQIPIKQALSAIEPNIMRSGCNSSDGIRVFRRLGFKVGEKERG